MFNLYGILISLGLLCSLLISEYISKKEHKDTNKLWGLALWGIIVGIVGARIYHVIDYMAYYSQDPIKILYVWNGGLGIWGGIFGGVLGIATYLKFNKNQVKEWLDILAISAPVGQAIGRWGNFFNQELFGKPTDLPWGIIIEPEKRPNHLSAYTTYHPLFLYESLLSGLLFLILFRLWKRSQGVGSLLYTHVYLFGYGVIRTALENLRIDPWEVYGLNVAQMVSILVMLYAGIHIIRSSRIRTKKRT